MLAKILFDDRIAHNFDPRPPEETDMVVQSFLPITRSVPANRMYESYLVAMENRQAGNNFQITAVEIVQGWREIQNKQETYGTSQTGQKLLPENTKGACQRCFGTGKEQMLGGGVKDSCDHRPLTKDEENARIQERINQVEAMRAELKKPIETKPVEVKPTFRKLNCDACGRRVSTFQGWTEGENCNDIIDDSDPDKPVICDGVIR